MYFEIDLIFCNWFEFLELICYFAIDLLLYDLRVTLLLISYFKIDLSQSKITYFPSKYSKLLTIFT